MLNVIRSKLPSQSEEGSAGEYRCIACGFTFLNKTMCYSSTVYVNISGESTYNYNITNI